MSEFNLSILIGSVVAGAAPIVLAAVGENITEKSGVINLSLDGSILLSAMVAFLIAYETQSLALGFLGGAVAGGLVASLLGMFSIYLKQSQVAVGFVLTLTARDLASFDESSASWVTEAGTYTVKIGASSADIRARGSFTVAREEKVATVSTSVGAPVSLTMYSPKLSVSTTCT